MDFSSETMEARWKWHNIFEVLKKRTINLDAISNKNILWEWAVEEILRWREIKQIYWQQTYPERTAWGVLFNRKKMINRILGHWEGRKNTATKNIGKCDRFFFSSFLIEIKVTTLPGVVPNVCKGNISDSHMNWGEKRK